MVMTQMDRIPVSFMFYYENGPLTRDAFSAYISLDSKRQQKLLYEKESPILCLDIHNDVTLHSGLRSAAE